MSFFLGVPATESLRTALHAMGKQLALRPDAVRWERPEKYHLTLVFLGEVAEARRPLLHEVLAAAAGPAVPPLTVHGVGVFPDPRRARVLWAGISAGPELYDLQRRLAAKAGELGFPVESRPWHAHLTLGRFTARGGFPAAPYLGGLEREWGLLPVERVLLYESRMGSYTVIAEAGVKAGVQSGGLTPSCLVC